MNLSTLTIPLLKTWINAKSTSVALLFFGVGTLIVDAQDVVAPTPQSPTVPQAVQAVLNAEQTDLSSLQAVAAATPEVNPLTVGPVTVLPHFLYRFLYGNGIQATPGHQSITAINSLSPGILLDLGTSWSFDYTPTWNLYSNHLFRDTVDESMNLVGAGNYDNLALQFSQTYVFSADPLVETGMQTNETEYVTKFGALYRLNSKLVIDSSLSQDYRLTEGFSNSLDWSTQDWLNYTFSPRLQGGIGGGLGYVDESVGFNEFYVRPEADLTLEATDKITIVLHGGVENRRFVGESEPSLNSPIYDLSVQYQPDETTKLTLGVAKEVDVSYFENQTTRSTQLNATLSQRLLERFYLSANVAQQTVDYLSSVSELTGRRDNEVSYSIRLSTSLLKRGSVALLYQWHRNSSTTDIYSFTSAQYGFELGYRF